MKYSEQIKPISYLKAHASEIAKDANENGKTFIITQNGYAKLAIVGIKEYERTLREINSLEAMIRKEKLHSQILNKSYKKREKNNV
ncbi:MAG TPA: type II toxin-antitoxin system Phd/YefM family antitoxin [Ignavibacteria bacterium]|nr:type II toxin-antitoxin system Phd/YefM family antitoxin [Ignavibacteria bacterium]